MQNNKVVCLNVLPDGTIAIEAHGKYLKAELDKVTDFDHQQEEWQLDRQSEDPTGGGPHPQHDGCMTGMTIHWLQNEDCWNP